MDILRIKDFRVEFPSETKIRPAVDGVSIAVRENKTLAIVGESGSGKTVLCLSSIGLVPGQGKITSGEVIFDGEDLRALSASQLAKIRGKEISVVFQEPTTYLNPVLKVGRQIAEVLQIHTEVSYAEALETAEELMRQVGISDSELRIDNYPHQMSGGMNQRVMIASALACKPKLVIADEPTTALDVTIQAQILHLLRELKENSNLSLVLITHDFGVVAEMADDVAVMYAGHIIETGAVMEIYNAPSHPYTHALMGAVPPIDQDIDALRVIKGSLPAPNEFFVGCIYAPRCENQIDQCLVERPRLEEVNRGHYCACFNPRTGKR